MKQEKLAAGDSVKMMCSACDSEQDHMIQSVTKLGKTSKAVCSACGTISSFSRGVKVAVEMRKSKAALPYDRTRKYHKGQAMMHAIFGQGEVTAVLEPQKIDVLFGDTTRRLIHAQD